MKLRYIAQAAAAILMLASCTDNDYTVLDKGSEPLELKASSAQVELAESAHSATAVELDWTTGTNYGTGNRITYTLELAEAGTSFAEPYAVLSEVTQQYQWAPSVETLNAIMLDKFHATAGQPMAVEARVLATVAGMEGVQESVASFSVTPYKPVTETLYLIGDAAPNGWSADAATALARVDNGVFTWTGEMKEGNFKFILNQGSFLPSYNNNGKGGLVLRTEDDQPDEQFAITEAGYYRIDVNLLSLTISVTPTQGVAPEFPELYFVGEETDWNFRPMNADPLDPFIFKLGVFFTKDGEFKFGTTSGSWENMFKATQPNAPYTDTSMELVKGFDPDNKWYLNPDETNKAYKISVDTRTGQQRMLMREFTPYATMYLVGDATPNGWDLGNATPMTVDASDPNIFTWTGNLTAGELKFSADKRDDWNGAWFLAPTEGCEPNGTAQTVIFIDKSDSWFSDMYTEIAVGDVDRKWKITEAGNYTITLNQLLDQVTFVKN